MYIERLQELEQRIIDNEQTGLRARWDFGRELLPLRKGKKLPPDKLDEIIEKVGMKARELQARMKFATKYPDEAAFSDAVRQFPTWHAMVHHGLTDKPRATGATPAEQLAELNPDDVADHRVKQIPNTKRLQRMLAAVEELDPVTLIPDDLKLLAEIEDAIRRVKSGVSLLKEVA